MRLCSKDFCVHCGCECAVGLFTFVCGRVLTHSPLSYALVLFAAQGLNHLQKETIEYSGKAP